ncbi:MAG: serine-aspartate repeat-containing protein, partial [Solirubrobacteraceae bacterium]|nr:serine-aspartate repeat-containing protein [Solirubrobacteraceae bacterium]
MQGHGSAARRPTDVPQAAGSGRGRLALLAGMLMLLALPIFAAQASAALPLTPVPAFSPVNDENGVDDQPGQKDLSLQAVATPAPGDLWVMWQWDVTALSGGNTGDACALFDTNSNSKVNFAVCVTIEKDPAVQAAVSPRVYTCGDGKVDRCTSTYTQISPINTACATNRDASDPFHSGQTDTQAICHVSLGDVGGTGVAKLVNTCSYPSQTPTSDPSDCVLIPRDAFITIVKNATPNNTGTQFPFRLGTSATADSNPILCTITNSGSCQTIAIRSGVAHTLKEVTPTGWGLDTPAPACTGASGSGSSNGTPSGATISAIKASSDNIITCTYNNKQLTGAIRVTKLHSGTNTTLSGAVFTIGSFTGQTTGSDGTVCKEGLALGTYTVTETQAPNG